MPCYVSFWEVFRCDAAFCLNSFCMNITQLWVACFKDKYSTLTSWLKASMLCITLAQWNKLPPFIRYSRNPVAFIYVLHGVEYPHYENIRSNILIRLADMGQINSSTHGQNGYHFTDAIFKCIFVNKKFCILISLKFVPKGPIENNPAFI